MIPDGYELDGQISNTPTAQVWTALDPTGARVVLKLSSAEERVERRFKREIEAMQAAAGPFTMPVLEHDASYSWYSMPVADQTLWDVDPPVSVELAIEVLEAAAAALGPIHASGQVHRDLKPQNILRLTHAGTSRWVIADFGIVRNAPGLTSQQLTRADGLTGTEGWAAPEQYRDAHIATVAADVYAMGGIVSWLLSGVRPAFGSVQLPDSPRLRAAVKRATLSNPSARFQSLTELLAAVNSSLETAVTSFESLVTSKQWGDAGAFVAGHPSHLDRFVTDLPRLTVTEVREWYAADPAGLVASVADIADGMAADYSDLSFRDIDRFLSWTIHPVSEALRNGHFDGAEELATSVFGATASIGQFAPASDAIEWMKQLDKRGQEAMETSLHVSGSYDFFARQASERWQSRGENDLVRKLRENR
ncbi:protein kinase [Microbacterium enclense]|uniref:protein kinase domain-containing protein n=1 Tax=Microbacterium enclense TaxID=993073 RepID=UPI0036DB56D1